MIITATLTIVGLIIGYVIGHYIGKTTMHKRCMEAIQITSQFIRDDRMHKRILENLDSIRKSYLSRVENLK